VTTVPLSAPEAPAQALTFDEARDRLRIGRSTLFRIVAAGELPSVKIGRSRRFLAEDVDAYLRGLRETA
jgi:excisionase family DNA binding protein